MFARVAIVLAAFAAVVSAQTPTVSVSNQCAEPVAAAFFPFATYISGEKTGGTTVEPGSTKVLFLDPHWSGRIWARTGCDADFNCETGNCQGGLNCTSPAAAGPTLAQFTMNGFAGLDFWNPSSSDGFNVPLAIIPGIGTFPEDSCSRKNATCVAAGDIGDGCGKTSVCESGKADYTVKFC